MTSTESANFIKAAREAGLHRLGVSIATARLLAEIQTSPLPMRTRTKGTHNVPSPSPKVSIGPLVTHALVVLADGFYATTPAGDEYLANLKREGLLK